MSKTFKSPLEGSSFEFNVGRSLGAENVFVSIAGPLDSASMAIAPSDAPAVCLAILEAAGHVDVSKGGHITPVSNAMYLLQEHIELEAVNAAAEADRVALEAEALALFNAHRISQGYESLDSFDGYALPKTHWLAVARAARELNKEAGQ